MASLKPEGICQMNAPQLHKLGITLGPRTVLLEAIICLNLKVFFVGNFVLDIDEIKDRMYFLNFGFSQTTVPPRKHEFS